MALNPDQNVVPRVPLHWDSWLRGSRDNPPTEEEVTRIAERVARGKSMSAKEMSDGASGADAGHVSRDPEKKNPFPTYDDLEVRAFGRHKKNPD